MSRMTAFWGLVERPSGAETPADQAGGGDPPQTDDPSQSEESQGEESQTTNSENEKAHSQEKEETPTTESQSEESENPESQTKETQSNESPYDEAPSEESESTESPSEEAQSNETPYDETQSEESESTESQTEESEGTQSPSEETQSNESPSEESTSEESESAESQSEEAQSSDSSSEEAQSSESQSEEALVDEAPSQPLRGEEAPSEESESEEPANTPAPLSKKDQNKQKNVEEATKKFGSSGSDFAQLNGADQLNPRQKQIFDEKLKKAIEKDPRAKKGTMKEADLKKLAQKAAEVTDKLSKTKLSTDVNTLSLKSETLKDNLVDLQNNGWKIKVGKRGKGSFTDKAAKTITIDPSQSTKDIVEGLAHETGHAEYTAPDDPSVKDPSPDVAKGREYIRKVVENALLDEGQAQIVACKTAKELEAKGETNINIPGTHSAEYKAVYAKIEAGTLTMDAGRKEMAKIMGSETTSNSSENYIDYYSKAPRKSWNKAHKKAKVPDAPRIAVFP